ncbi:hypothetical protein ksw1_27020 [Staphylococcus aureus]|nr:hypothetical protein ksw1_27020 [Staphylococcus aureus]
MRAIVVVDLERVADSCGYSIPRFAYKGERDTLDLWVERKDDEALATYQAQKNATIDARP